MPEKKPVKYQAKHSTAGKTVALRTTSAGKVERVATKLPKHERQLPGAAKHRASRGGQLARDTKGIVTFGASKTRSGFMKSFDNPAAPRLKPKKSVVTYRHILAAEFWTGLIIILFTKDEETKNGVTRWVQLAAWVLVFAVLFGMTVGGASAGKFAAALGGLILLTVMVKKRTDIFSLFPALTGTSQVGPGTDVPFPNNLSPVQRNNLRNLPIAPPQGPVGPGQ